MISCKPEDQSESFVQTQESQESPDQEDYVQVQPPVSDELEAMLDRAEANATPEGRHILETARSMIASQEIVIGSCWDYMNVVYKRAGNQKQTIFSSRFQGPYLREDLIEPGDWLYFVNHTYYDGEHSGIFVAWLDAGKKEALMINYVGENRVQPGRYKRYVIDEVYNIMRATYY